MGSKTMDTPPETTFAGRPVPDLRTEIPGPRAREILARDERYVSPSYTRSYPLVIARGRGCTVEDVDGNLFLDVNAGIAVLATGHAHPRVVQAIREQAGRFVHMAGTDFYYDVQSRLCERLATLAPFGPDARVFLSNSGAEAVECALKLARHRTGRPYVVSFLGGFHGRTMGALGITASKPIQRRGFAPFAGSFVHAPYAYCYRCPVNLQWPGCEAACADWIEEQLFAHQVPADEVAAIFVEAMQGEGGYVPPPDAFLRKIREVCDRHGILMVVDEVQSGCGRTGKMFAIEHTDVVPDVITMAKGIASGLPLGATVAKTAVMEWPSGAHANTFGGNPVACAAALETLDLLEESLMDNARVVGDHLQGRMRELAGKHDLIGDVRGRGLMVGVELVRDRKTREPAPSERDAVAEAAFCRGLLILGAGTSTLRLSPPLVITREEADTAARILDEALGEVGAARS